MVTRLLESGGRRRRSTGGAVSSMVLHGALILGAIHATAHAARRVADAPPEIEPLVFHPKVAPPLHPPAIHESGAHSAPPSMHIASLITAIPQLSFGAATITSAPPVVSAGEFDHGLNSPFTGAPGIGEQPALIMNPSQVDRAAEPVPGTVAPHYPEALRAVGVQGIVVAQFVVDTAGRVEIGSFRAVRPVNDQFAAAVLAALERARFQPALLNGTPVRQSVEQSFSFVLR